MDAQEIAEKIAMREKELVDKKYPNWQDNEDWKRAYLAALTGYRIAVTECRIDENYISSWCTRDADAFIAAIKAREGRDG